MRVAAATAHLRVRRRFGACASSAFRGVAAALATLSSVAHGVWSSVAHRQVRYRLVGTGGDGGCPFGRRFRRQRGIHVALHARYVGVLLRPSAAVTQWRCSCLERPMCFEAAAASGHESSCTASAWPPSSHTGRSMSTPRARLNTPTVERHRGSLRVHWYAEALRSEDAVRAPPLWEFAWISRHR